MSWETGTGYNYWHQVGIVDSETSSAPRRRLFYFANTNTRDFLYQSLMDRESGIWVGVVENLTGSNDQGVVLSRQLEKATYVLSWVCI